MKRSIKLAAAGLILAAMVIAVACSMGGNNGTTVRPNAGSTVGPTRDAYALTSGEPFASGAPLTSGEPVSSGAPVNPSPSASAGPDLGSAEPSHSPEANATAGFGGHIEGFVEGTVVDPEEIPEIVAALGREFPDYTVQSATYELLEGSEAYRITLQGNGELARMVYVFGDGTILIPGGMD